MFSVNAELVRLYWDIGRLIDARQKRAGWGAGVIPQLAQALRNELPEEKGFSERNIGRMIAFFRAYPSPSEFLPQAVAKLESIADSILWSIPWGHHALLLEKLNDSAHRIWYMAETLANGWSRSVLLLMIQSEAHRRKGEAISNFDQLLPAGQSDLARQTLKDPYIFDFLTLDERFHERELETRLLHQLEKFLIELGQGFAFVGRQYRIEVGNKEFFIDLLFYHLQLRCYVVIDLKKGEFNPEYAGKMNFYLGVVDDKLRHSADVPSIGIILCQDRSHIVAEYALRGMSKPIGVSAYELTRALPRNLRSALPTVEEIEAELCEHQSRQTKAAPAPRQKRPRITSKKRKPKSR